MFRLPKLSRRARWAVPAGAVAITGAVIAATLIPSAQASPVLPVRSGAQLLAAVGGGTGKVSPFTGTVVENAALGLPNLPGVDDPTSMTSMLTGSHTIRIWYGGPGRVRVSMPGQLSESDVIANGNTVWYWQSKPNAVTKLQLPARQHHTHQIRQPKLPVLTPQQAARQAIAAVGPSTRVSVQSNVVVAGQNAYQLALTPKSPSSLIGSVRIAIDARNSMPLRVQVYPRRAANPAFQVGFTSISFVAPAAANFSFSPPPGAKVTTETPSGQDSAAPMLPQKAVGGPTVMGKDWLSVAVLPADSVNGLLGGMAGKSSASASGVASSAAQSAAGTPSGSGSSGVSASALLGTLLHTATPVHGAWGSGKLLHTSLLSVLITSNGHVLLGAVTPSVLYADAAHLK
jgi:outer membrane lipoprotein-sorting protein